MKPSNVAQNISNIHFLDFDLYVCLKCFDQYSFLIKFIYSSLFRTYHPFSKDYFLSHKGL